MGIWEQMPERFMDDLEREFGFEVPREHGVDALKGIKGMRDGEIKVWFALGGNLVGAIADGLRRALWIIDIGCEGTNVHRTPPIASE